MKDALLSKQIRLFHRFGLVAEEGDFVYLEESFAVFFTQRKNAPSTSRPPFDERPFSFKTYADFRELSAHIQTILRPSRSLALNPKEIPYALYEALEKVIPSQMIETETFSLPASKKDRDIFEECLLGVENAFLYFLSVVYSTSFDSDEKLAAKESDEEAKRFAIEINRFLESRGSLEKKARVCIFKHLDSTFVQVGFSFAKGGLILPFDLLFSLDEKPNPIKEALGKVSAVLLKSCREGLFNHVKRIENFLEETFKEEPFDIQIDARVLSTSSDFIRLNQDETPFAEGETLRLEARLTGASLPEEGVVWSNLFTARNGCLRPLYRTNEVFLEIEV